MTNVKVASSLMSTRSDGPAVSLNGSLMVSPETAAFVARRDRVFAEHAPTEVTAVGLSDHAHGADRLQPGRQLET